MKIIKPYLPVTLSLLLLFITSCSKNNGVNNPELMGRWERSGLIKEMDNTVFYWTDVLDFRTSSSGYVESYHFNNLDYGYIFSYNIDDGNLNIDWGNEYTKSYNYAIRNDSLFMESIELPHMSYRDYRVYTRLVEKQFESGTVEIPCYDYYCANTGDFCIRFDTVFNDSRCPADVICVWEGNAELGFTFITSESVIPFKLNTYKGYTTDTIIENFKFELKNVFPAPLITDTIFINDYIATLHVEEL